MLIFTKMEGIGNDYIYFNGIHQNIPLNQQFIRNISAFHTGIGSDGMIVILLSDKADFMMRIFNRDGSEAKMCGNGIRCFAKFVYDHHLTDKTTFEIETLGGIKKVWLHIEDNEVVSVKVDMGHPIINTRDIPCLFSKNTIINEKCNINHQTYHITALSMGNPHAVIFVDNLDLNIKEIGSALENHALFPEGVNTAFVQVISPQYLKVRVWEKGSEETMGCGTGACASMFASYLNGLCFTRVQVELPGGILDISYENDHIYMSGPVKTVFDGCIKEEDYL